ncbi:MAG TPA: 3-phosphoshikimate 1-carboxyvinyltransferase [Chloroflexi bacterium]|nr:3-phosphoshikimate 1-carboxyvinyltransferase [Chloroflexota bacterium]
MCTLIVRVSGPLRGTVSVPGDKSISHRAILLAALADGVSRIVNFLDGDDCRATLDCVRALGVPVEAMNDVESGLTLTVYGRGIHSLQAPTAPLDCRRSGTTMRLLTGLLAAQPFDSVLTGDPQLLRRPMGRVVEPLCSIGARIEAREDGSLAIQRTDGHRLHGREHILPVASAQLKSALLLAGLYADGPTIIHQPGPARDHTERMLAAQIEEKGEEATSPAFVFDAQRTMLVPQMIERLRPLNMRVPGDVSSAVFPLVAALLQPGSQITLTGVGLNPTRTGFLDVLVAMGATTAMVTTSRPHSVNGELVADIIVTGNDGSTRLHGTTVSGPTVIRMIDEFPLLAVVATQAQGVTVVRNAAELRVKETDRIAGIVAALRRLGADIEARPDGFVVRGPTPLYGASVDSRGDHRLAMALAVAGLIATGETVIQPAGCIADSFPGFVGLMQTLGAACEMERSSD